jgi:membrane-associated protease RseP (regulator of RpoE activity)
MSAPRHLWSGDWELESAAAAEELGKHRSQTGEDAPIRVVDVEATPRPSLTARAAAWLRDLHRGIRVRRASRRAGRRTVRVHRAPRRAGRRRIRLGVLLAVALLVIAGAAFGVTSLLAGSGRPQSATVSGGHPWLGIEMTNSPFAALGIQTVAGAPLAGGAIVTSVVAGSPAAAAGLERGDVITAIDNRQVTAPSDVESAIAGLHVGDQVSIQYERGLVTYTTRATLSARPARYP